MRVEGGFAGKATVPWDSKVLYKFVVDSKWTPDWDKPNIITASNHTFLCRVYVWLWHCE